MPGTLPSGAPYILGTDAANTIDSTDLAAAQYWDARTPLAYYSGTTGSFSASVTVTFPVGKFAAVPAILCSLKSTVATNNAYVTYSFETTTAVTFYKWKSDGTAATVTNVVSYYAVSRS